MLRSTLPCDSFLRVGELFRVSDDSGFVISGKSRFTVLSFPLRVVRFLFSFCYSFPSFFLFFSKRGRVFTALDRTRYRIVVEQRTTYRSIRCSRALFARTFPRCRNYRLFRSSGLERNGKRPSLNLFTTRPSSVGRYSTTNAKYRVLRVRANREPSLRPIIRGPNNLTTCRCPAQIRP